MARVKKFKLGDCVLVHWIDAVRLEEWRPAGDVIEDADIFSVGFVHLMPSDADKNITITIAGDVDTDDGANGRKIKIPMGCVVDITVLRIPERQ